MKPNESTLIGPDGQIVHVTALTSVAGFKSMRDLTVANVHTYYVVAGGKSVLVHNNCQDDPLVDVFRFADRREPADLLPKLAQYPVDYQDRIARLMRVPAWRAQRIEDHAQGDYIDSPFVSVAASPFKAAATDDPELYSITRGTPDLGFFQIPSSKLIRPRFELSTRETELLVEGGIEKYLVGWIPNPFKGQP